MTDVVDFNKVFNDSYEFVLEHEYVFYERFYENFLNTSPRVKEAFQHTNIDRQKRMLHGSIVHMINFSVTKVASQNLIKVAESHKFTHSIDDDLYQYFLNAFITTLKQTYPQFNNECEVAWRITLAPGIEFMKHITETVCELEIP